MNSQNPANQSPPRDHVVICGLGRKGMAHLRRLTAEPRAIAVIDNDPKPEYARMERIARGHQGLRCRFRPPQPGTPPSRRPQNLPPDPIPFPKVSGTGCCPGKAELLRLRHSSLKIADSPLVVEESSDERFRDLR